MATKKRKYVLRPILMKDLQGYWETMQDPVSKKCFTSTPSTLKEARAEVVEKIRKNNQKTILSKTFTIEVDNKFAGNVQIQNNNFIKKTHVGRVHLWIHPDFRGMGLATAVLKKIVELGFTKYKFKRIVAQCRAFNKAVARVNEKVGFKLEGVLRKDAYKNGKYFDNLLYAIVK